MLYRERREECYAANNGCIKTHDTRDHLSSAVSRDEGVAIIKLESPTMTIAALHRPEYPISCYSTTECPPDTAWHRRSRYHPIHALSYDIFSLIDRRPASGEFMVADRSTKNLCEPINTGIQTIRIEYVEICRTRESIKTMVAYKVFSHNR